MAGLLYECGQARLTPNVQQAGQECEYQGRIRRAEGQLPDQHAHIGPTSWITMSRFVAESRDLEWVLRVIGCLGIARHCKAAGGRNQHKIVLRQFDAWLSVEGKPCRSFEDKCKERASVAISVHAPISGSARRL